MKRIFFILMVFLSNFAFGQFREQIENRPTVHDGIINNEAPSMILGFINPDNFEMNHSYNLSYSAFGNQGLALGVYTNSMFYKFADNLNIQADVSLVNSPYSTFGKDFSKQINGVYLSKASLNYKPWDNVQINVQYNSYPMGYGYYSPYGYSRYNNGFSNDWFWDR